MSEKIVDEYKRRMVELLEEFDARVERSWEGSHRALRARIVELELRLAQAVAASSGNCAGASDAQFAELRAERDDLRQQVASAQQLTDSLHRMVDTPDGCDLEGAVVESINRHQREVADLRAKLAHTERQLYEVAGERADLLNRVMCATATEDWRMAVIAVEELAKADQETATYLAAKCRNTEVQRDAAIAEVGKMKAEASRLRKERDEADTKHADALNIIDRLNGDVERSRSISTTADKWNVELSSSLVRLRAELADERRANLDLAGRNIFLHERVTRALAVLDEALVRRSELNVGHLIEHGDAVCFKLGETLICQCGKHLGAEKWWQDVPGEGNMCDPCHAAWLAKGARP